MFSLLQLITRFGRALAIAGLVAVVLTFAVAQQNNDLKKPISIDPANGNDNKEPFSQAEEEMRAKRAIREADKQYQENLDRARDLSSLGASIVTSFKQKNGLNQEDIKRLEKVEKLAKGIRQAAGGSEDRMEMDNPPRDLATAMQMLNDLSQSLKAKVEKTPKHVISATVIDEANVLLELIRIVRALPPKV